MWPRTDLLDLFGVLHPIIQVQMSGFGGAALVAAVSSAGSLGCGALPKQTARRPHGRGGLHEPGAFRPFMQQRDAPFGGELELEWAVCGDFEGRQMRARRGEQNVGGMPRVLKCVTRIVRAEKMLVAL